MESLHNLQGLNLSPPTPYHADSPTFGSRDGDTSKKKIPGIHPMHIAFGKNTSSSTLGDLQLPWKDVPFLLQYPGKKVVHL